MVMVCEDTTTPFAMDGYHKTNLDVAKDVVKKDWDMIFIYDGAEGAGKSVKAMQDAFYCDTTLNIDRIVFNDEDFKKVILSSQKYQSIVYDEAYGGLGSRAAMSTVNKAIVQMLTVIRERNLFIFIVLPTFFDLDKYVALWRSRALIHIYAHDGFQRGFFKFYNNERKKIMYVAGKKYYDYRKGKPNFIGRFSKKYVIDEDEYRKKKRETSLTIGNDDSNTTGKILKDIAIHLYVVHGWSVKKIVEALPRNQAQIYRFLEGNLRK